MRAPPVTLSLAGLVLVAACAHRAPTTGPRPDNSRAAAETVTVRDPDLEQRAARLELRVLERDAEIEDLQARLDEAQREVVRSMAKLQTLATRAEAASAMAEAELALQSLRSTRGGAAAGEAAQAARLLELATAEFDKSNYGGALYAATQAKTMAGTGRGRLLSQDPGSLRPGEVLFALPLKLQASGRSNVRDGPAPAAKVLFTVTNGTDLTGYSYLNDWVRVTDDSSRTGWIHQSRIAKRP